MTRSVHILILSVAVIISMIPLAGAQDIAIPDRPTFLVVLEPGHVKKEGAYVQGQILLRVQLVSPDPFRKLKLTLPPIDNVRTVTIRKPHTREVNTYGGKGYSYETRLALFPEKSGTVTIPEITVVGETESADGENFAFTESHPARTVTIHPIDPAFDGDWWLVAHKVVMDQNWSKEIAKIREGDTVQRKVYLAVHGATVEQLPELVQTANAGYSVLGTDVQSKTEKTKNGLVTQIVQTWDIHIDTRDVLYVSPIQFKFWNPEQKKVEVASVSAQRIEPLPQNLERLRHATMEAAIAAHEAKRLGLWLLLAIPGLVLATLIALLIWKSLPTKADRQLHRACREESSAAASYRAGLSWADNSFGWRSAITGSQADILGRQAKAALTQLNRALFARAPEPFDSKEFAGALTGAARRLRIKQLLANLSAGYRWLTFAR